MHDPHTGEWAKQIIGVSRGSLFGGKEFAAKLAAKLGYDCISREEIIDSATEAGIPIGKLELAVTRRQPLSERLNLIRERYAAFVAATFCERVEKRSIVYHGRTGHLVLPGVADIFRIRVICDPEQRIASIMESLRVSRQKAQKYIEGVDEDRRRWVRTLYNVNWQDPKHYDAVVNLSRVGVDNAASATVAMAQLPEFQITPASQRILEDLLVAARCRLAIGDDPRTHDMSVQVRSVQGRVSVTYIPRQQHLAGFIPDVIGAIDGVDEVICTLACRNILWIQERYNPECESLSEILEIANRWNAAVELIQFASGDDLTASQPDESRSDQPESSDTVDDDGGILDDNAAEEEIIKDEGLRLTSEKLISAGHAGGCRVVPGGMSNLVASVDRNTPYSLVVLGDVFTSKIPSVRKRLCNEMVSFLTDQLRVPVIQSDELRTQYFFGPAQWRRLLFYGCVAAMILILVFMQQEALLRFTSREGLGARILGAMFIFIFVPILAFSYGSFTRYLLRLLRFE